MAIVLVARFRWARTNLWETYFTNLLMFLLLTVLLEQRHIEELLSRGALLTVTAAQELAFFVMALAATEMIGFTMLWTRRSPERTRRAHRKYRAGALVLGAAFLAAATRARAAGQTLEIAGGWDSVLALALDETMLFILAGRLIWMFSAELMKRPPRQEFVVALGGLLLGMMDGAGSLEALGLAVTDQLGWTRTVRFRLWFHGLEFFWVAVAVYILGVVPLALKLIAQLGMDRTGRSWNRLQPLRLDMTALVPQSSFNLEQENQGARKSALQLHQTVIEIRDAILQLRPYFRDLGTHELAAFLAANSVPQQDQAAAAHALQLAHASIAKSTGAEPQRTDLALVARSRSASLKEDATELLSLARWWTPARIATGQVNCAHGATKAGTPA